MAGECFSFLVLFGQSPSTTPQLLQSYHILHAVVKACILLLRRCASCDQRFDFSHGKHRFGDFLCVQDIFLQRNLRHEPIMQ